MVKNKDRWSALSMKERADLMNMYITNGISDLKEMKKHYNSFGDGGDTEQESNSKTTSLLKQTIRKAKAGVMDVLQKYQYEPLTEAIKDTWHDIQFGTGSKKDYASNKYEDVAQDSFLFSRKEQKDAFLNSGYIEGTAGDYGLVAKAVGNRNLPVYQSSKDDITRDKLTVIGNLPSMFFGEGELVHAGYYPTALYKDTEGNIYQKAWDLQDYGPDSTGTGGYYSQYPIIKQLGSKILDMVGNPVVRTTGFQQISDGMLYNLMYQIKDSKLWSELMNTKASNAGNTVMGERVLEAYEDLLFMKAQELADKENREFAMKDYDYIKKTLPLEIFKSNITNYYDPKALSEVYSIFIGENKFATGGPTREMTPSEAAALNKTLNNSQYMLAVGDSPDDPAYLSTDILEPAAVKAFDSNEAYNRYYGEKFGKQIARKRDKVANSIVHALEYTPFVGDGIDAANTIASINEGDYSKAAVLAGLALLPNAIEKPLKGAKKIGRSITHAFSSDYLPTILSDKFGRGVINPSMAVSPATKTFDNLYGDIVLVGDKTLLDDSFLFRGDGDTSAVGWFTDAYDEVRDVHKVSSQMRAHDVNSPVPQLTKERFLELEAHPEYHEAKRNRITGLNEFKHALVPEEFMQNQEMLEYLNEMGIPYSSYSEGNKVQAINAFLEKHPELLFKYGGKLNKN